MKYLPLVLFVLMQSCYKENRIAHREKYDYSRPIIFEAVQKLHTTGSLDSTSIYIEKTYGIPNFKTTYIQMRYYFKNFSAFEDSLLSKNVKYFLKDISSVFQKKQLLNDDSVISKLTLIKIAIEKNQMLGDEKHELILASNVLINNYGELVNCVKENQIREAVIAMTKGILVGSYLGKNKNFAFGFSLAIAGAAFGLSNSIYPDEQVNPNTFYCEGNCA